MWIFYLFPVTEIVGKMTWAKTKVVAITVSEN